MHSYSLLINGLDTAYRIPLELELYNNYNRLSIDIK